MAAATQARPVRPPLTVEHADSPAGRVSVLHFGDLFTGPDGVTQVLPLRRQATGDALGESVLALLAERDALRARVADLEAERDERRGKRFVRKD